MRESFYKVSVDRSLRGFTLVELVITIAITSMLTALASPNLRNALFGSYSAAATNELVAALNFARSDALARRSRVTVCRSANSMAAVPSCGGNDDADWSAGFVVFVDVDGDNAITDPNANGILEDGEDLVLRVHGAFPDPLSIRKNGNPANRITFRSNGTLRGNMSSLFLCDARGELEGRKISLGATGRVNLQSLTSGDSCSA